MLLKDSHDYVKKSENTIPESYLNPHLTRSVARGPPVAHDIYQKWNFHSKKPNISRLQ